MLKINVIVKIACFYVIPYTHSQWRAISAHISGDHNHVSRCKFNIFKLYGLNRQDKISFDAMPRPNIPSLTVLLEKLSDKIGWIGDNGSPSVQCLAQTY